MPSVLLGLAVPLSALGWELICTEQADGVSAKTGCGWGKEGFAASKNKKRQQQMKALKRVARGAQSLQGPVLTMVDKLSSRAEAVLSRAWAVSSKWYAATT